MSTEKDRLSFYIAGEPAWQALRRRGGGRQPGRAPRPLSRLARARIAALRARIAR